MSRADRKLLVIDDDSLFCHSVERHFSGELSVASVGSGKAGVEWCRNHRIDVVLLDQKLPDGEGIELCEQILACNDQTKIIFITAFPSFEHAVRALRNGAHDYLSKPVELEELALAVSLAFRTVRLEHVEQIQRLKEHQDSLQNRLLCLEGGLAPISELVVRAASNRVPVLITGETGTGKTALAKAIHYLHGEREQPFIDINCASLPENLIESELFGYEKGAFTGADKRKKGLFEMADGGCLFLDEIGEMPLHLQAKLLGVLDSGEIRRLGGGVSFHVDVRVLAATNVELEKAIAERRFREDLYYRMSVMRIHIPPLRERKEDVAELAHHFLATIAPDGKLQVERGEIEALLEYEWPGNVRELRNIIDRAVILSKGRFIYPSKLLRETHTEKNEPAWQEGPGTIATLAEVEKEYIRSVLGKLGENRTRTAKALGVARSTLIRKLDQYGLNANTVSE
ncbi:sigma-54 dependent transcriptional regulator [Desulfopila sp. IMCC35008]|uniref:sigma-54-dependent transcriptional regulator n=1 Tax=Desulfopila sp. IMCC35008 TaxID=2653858 RepID=UPI0013D3AE15|nr:sigma-54 dependent transcriptional regulator [Desulfopila sp. IMCC35008]